MAAVNKKKSQRPKQATGITGGKYANTKQQQQSTPLSSLLPRILVLPAILFLLVVVFNISNDDDTFNVNSTKMAKNSSSGDTKGRRRRNDPLPVLDQLFPFQSLDIAWEKYPLLSTTQPQQIDCKKNTNENNVDHGTTKEHQQQCARMDDVTSTYTSGSIRFHDNQIPTIYLDNDFSNDTNGDNATTTTGTNRWELSSLITQDGVLEHVLNAPNLVHGEDYRIVKKVVRDGQEWTGSLPDHLFKASTSSIQQTHQRMIAQRAIVVEGFSLIVNGLHKRWGPVAAVARQLEHELLPERVSCNLYLTPPPPPKNNNADTKSSGFESHWDWMDVIVMQLEGEKLWSVAKRPKMELSFKDQKHKPTMQDMKDYLDFGSGRYHEFLLRPGDVLYIPRGFIHNASTTSTGHDDSASLHLTFGIEHGCQTTVEAMIHHAIELYDARGRSSDNNNNIAIPSQACPLAGGRDIPWKDVVHFVLAEVARRDQVCAFTSNGSNGKSNNTSCVLRRSLPISPAFQQIMQHSSSSSATASVVVRDMLLNGLDVLLDLASTELTAQLIHRLEVGDGESIRSFCHPYMSPSSVVPCHDTVAKINMVDDAKGYNTMKSYLLELREYSIKEFDSIQQWFENHVALLRKSQRSQQDEELRMVGQSITPPMNK